MKPIVGITMGDPASIGPEITIKALAEKEVYEKCRPVVIGDLCVMEKALDLLRNLTEDDRIRDMRLRGISDIEEALFEYGTIDVLDMGLVEIDRLRIGEVSEMAGEAAFQYVVKVIGLAMEGKVDATVTNAFNKAAINLAGHHYNDACTREPPGRPCLYTCFAARGL